MAFTPEHIFKSIYCELGRNKIGNEGCKFLGKAHWPQLISINLKDNKIQSAGLLHLSKAKWPQLISINLST